MQGFFRVIELSQWFCYALPYQKRAVRQHDAGIALHPMKRTPHLLQFELLLKKGESKLRSVLVTDDAMRATLAFASREEALRWGVEYYPQASVTETVFDKENKTQYELRTSGLSGLPLVLILLAQTRVITFDELRASSGASETPCTLLGETKPKQ